MQEPQASASTDVSTEAKPSLVIQTAWGQFQKIATEVNRPELLDDLKPSMDRFQLGLFRLVVMGEIKKGKSSFINALLGESLLPTQSDVATSTVYKVMYGPQKRFKVFFQPDIDTGKRPPLLEIQESQLAAYGTEDGNPQNQKRVDFIGVELPNSLLKDGVVLVDTPGVGGLFKAHRDITWRYAPNADAIFFILDSVEAVVSRDEIEFLKDLTSKVTKRVFFIQTKIDVPDTEQWKAWQNRNRELLIKELGIPSEQVYYFPVSSKLKALADKTHSGEHLTESGFMTVLDFLRNGLIATKERQMAKDVALGIGRGCLQLRQGLEEQLRIFQQHTQEQFETLAQEYKQARDNLDRWERTTYQQEIQRFSDRFTDVRQRNISRLQTELDPMGPLSKGVVELLRADQLDAKQLNDTAGKIQQTCLAQAAEQYEKIQSDFNEQAKELILDVANNLARDFVVPECGQIATTRDQPAVTVEESLHMVFNNFDEARTLFMGGTAAYGIAHLALPALALIFPPAAAVAGFATVLCALFGAKEAHEMAQYRRREEALNKLQGLLCNLLRTAQQQGISQFNESCTVFERRARDTFRQAAERARGDLVKRIKDVEDARTVGKEASQTRARQLEAQLKGVDALREVLRPLAAKIPVASAKA